MTTKSSAYTDSVLFMGLTPANGFDAGTLYSYKPTNGNGDFAVTRALGAYRTGQDGLLELMASNVPRIDYKNTCPELLVEQQSENLVLRSQEFNNASWGKFTTSVTSDSISAPDGTTTADTLTGGGGTTTKYIQQNVSLTSGTYTFSFYTKYLSHRYIQVLVGSTGLMNLQYTNVDLQTGSKADFNGAVSVVEQAPNGFYRISFTFPYVDVNQLIILLVDSLAVSRGASTSSTNSIYLWGAQLEKLPFSTSYIPTTTTSVVRPADFIQNNIVDYTLDEATIFIRARLDFSTTNKGIFTLSDNGIYDDYISMYYFLFDDQKFLRIETFTNPDTNVVEAEVFDDGICNIALAYKISTNNYVLAFNGSVIESGVFSNNLPASSVLTNFILGSLVNISNSRTITAMFFDSKLSNFDLENITA